MARFEPLTLAELPRAIWRTRLPVRFGSCDRHHRYGPAKEGRLQ